MMNSEALGKRIFHHRHMLGMTQEEAASGVGISASYYGNIERGSRIPSLETLIDLANLFHCDANALLRDSINCLSKLPQESSGNGRCFFYEPVAQLEDSSKEHSPE